MAHVPGEVACNGWHAVPLDPVAVLGGKPYIKEPGRLLVSDMSFPHEDTVVAKVYAYAKEKLPQPTFHHSMHVYYFATAMLRQQFDTPAAAALSLSMLALTCLLHDIGTTEENLAATRMSFEFYGGLLARATRPTPCARPSCGTITLLGQVLQLVTVYDNVGAHPALVHTDTRDDVNRTFPRKRWLCCFAATVRDEVQRKPWCHTTHIPDFETKIAGNELMRPYEEAK